MFETGEVILTNRIIKAIESSATFAKEIRRYFGRYLTGDWGALSDYDLLINDDAVRSGEDRIYAKYPTSMGQVSIITDKDRIVTAILFSDETKEVQHG